MVESTLKTFVAIDGENLAIQDWPLESGKAIRGQVLVVHGLGEHAGRYEEMARYLNSWGFAVRSYDHYGHGKSSGLPGVLPSPNRLVEDLVDVLSSTRSSMVQNVPLILLGHSMGGLVAARMVSLGLAHVDGLVLSSPVFDVELSPFRRLLLNILPSLAPNLRLHNGVAPKWVSRDPNVVQEYQQDKLVHDRISPRLAKFIVEAAAATLECAPQWKVPTLLMYAGQDRLASPKGSQAFVKAAPENVVTAHCYNDYYHEIFNELGRESVYERLRDWLDNRF